MSDAAIASRIEFTGEAYESAADHFRQLAGWLVEVHTTDGQIFDAFIGGGPSWTYPPNSTREDAIRVNEDTGQYEVLLTRSNDKSEPTGEAGYADIYDDLVKVVVY